VEWRQAVVKMHPQCFGDLVQMAADSRQDCLGTADHQVKLHSWRIELCKNAAALQSKPTASKSVLPKRRKCARQERRVALHHRYFPLLDTVGAGVVSDETSTVIPARLLSRTKPTMAPAHAASMAIAACKFVA
jgi:hypothetical protein